MAAKVGILNLEIMVSDLTNFREWPSTWPDTISHRMATVEFGIHTGQQDTTLDELRKLWRYCDGAGFKLITVWDHFHESPPRHGNGVCYESLALLSALALDTSRSRIGCLCFGMPYRNPAILAKALTTIDHLSHGRLTVGLGAAWHVPEHETYGIPFGSAKERLDRLSEGVRMVRMLFMEDRANFEGTYYQLRNAPNFPKPVQARVPIIVGGAGERRTLAIAARWADGSNQGYISPEAYQHKNDVLDQWCERFDRDPRSLERSIIIHFRMSSTGASIGGHQVEGAITGSVQEVTDKIGAYVEAGAQRISIVTRPPVDWEAMGLFVAEVMPKFQ